MWNSPKFFITAFLIAWIFLPAAASGGDEEGCMICHRLAIRKSTAEGGTSLRVSDQTGGPHDTLYCSDCHPDAKSAPHSAAPGAASCIGECHSSSTKASQTHRAASFGGLIEGHRSISVPRAPCQLCHRSTDRTSSRKIVAGRCVGCHVRERKSVSRGVHARIQRRTGDGMCADCHLAHGTSAKNDNVSFGKANCGGGECHARLTDGMKILGGHEKRAESGGKSGTTSAVGIFLAAAALGVASGRLHFRSARDRGKRT